MKPSSRRPGYAMMLVLVFTVLFLAVLTIAFRQISGTLRIETTQALRAQRDQGCVQALAQGLALLETGLPPSDPYVCAVVLATPAGPQSFTVTFASEGPQNWSVNAAPTSAGTQPPPMPNTFGPP